MDYFHDKVVLITGSSSGIGAATAIEFAKNGACVTITGRNIEALQEVADKIKEISGKEPLQIIGDLVDVELQKRLIDETVAHFGRLDVLINNAGTANPVDHIEHPDCMSGFDPIYDVNVKAPMNLIHLALPHFRPGSSVVNLSSVAAFTPMMPIYSSSKCALDMIGKCCALALAPKNIRINSVAPGPVATGFLRGVGIDIETGKAAFNDCQTNCPLPIQATGEDLAASIVFLANSDLCRNITGALLANDSGALLNPAASFAFVEAEEGVDIALVLTYL